MLVEKLLLCLVNDAMLIEELMESGIRIFKRVLPAQQFIIVGPFVSVGENLECLRDIMKLGLCCFAVFLVFVRMPLGS